MFLRVAASLLLVWLAWRASAQCPAGWTQYNDTDGTEGQNSCLRLNTSAPATWAVANSTGCTPGAILVSINAPNASTGLPTLMRSMASGYNYWVGCTQAWASSAKNFGWYWVDSTSGNNIKSAVANQQNFGIWTGAQPECEPVSFAVPVEY